MSRKWLEAPLNFFIDNITVIGTVGYASYVIYRQQISNAVLSTDDLLTAVLTILGLLAISEIIERYRKLGSIEKTNQKILGMLESQLTERPSALAFFQVSSSLATLIKSSSTIDMCGLTMTTTLNKEFPNILEKIEQGSNVRLLIVDPDSQALQMSALRSFDPTNLDYYRNKIVTTLQDIEFIHQRWEVNRKNNLKRSGNFEVRLLNFAPSFSVFVFNAVESSGHAIVEIYPHKKGFGTPPAFELTSARDGDWYKYFTSQFEQMWDDAKEWHPKTKSA
jgi:hypothetical protein